MSNKWNFPETEYEGDQKTFIELPEERFMCTLHKITEKTLNTKYGLKEAIQLGLIPTEKSLAENGITLKDDEMCYVTALLYLTKSEKGKLWKTLKGMAAKEEIEGLQPNDATGVQSLYEALIGRVFDVIVMPSNGFNNAQAIFRTKQPVQQKLVEEETGFEDMPDKGALADEITFEEDEIPF